jgi:type II secretory pathway component GspD/PulD (secretin)
MYRLVIALLTIATLPNWTTVLHGRQDVVFLNGSTAEVAMEVAEVQVAEEQPAEQPPADVPTPPVTMRKVIGPDGNPTEIPIPEGTPLPPGFKPADGGDPSKPGKGKDGQPPGAAGNGGPPAEVQRPKTPPSPPDRKELQVKPDDEGMVQFSFRNQSWPDLLKWIADVSGMSLDWQELPGDFVNIATQRKFTLEETRDLFNRHLLARGFTMIELDGILYVSKTDKLNPALVPKVEPNQLATQPPNRFVRTTFSLTSLIASDVVEEFNALKSPNGKLTALAATNRIEAMDTAGNLNEIYRIISDEQSETALENLAREFPLEHVRAADVKEQLEMFLGVKKATSNAMSPEQMAMMQQQMQQQMQMQMQQQQQGGGRAKPKPQAGSGDVNIAANSRLNCLIVHAPPDKMALIASFIKRWDVPSNSEQNLNAIQSRMKVYRLTSLDPDRFAKSLQGMDVLEPSTRLEIDKDNNAIIAYASLADQYTIQQMIERLDGSAREFAVLQLRRLDAEEVAGTIKSMMVSPQKKDSNQDRYRYWDPWGNSGSDKKKTEDEFRVGANVRDNQLLLWANDKELDEVNKFLVKLGEVPPSGSSLSPIRTIDAARSPETYEYLKKIQEQWQRMSPNPIILPDSKIFQPTSPATAPPTKKTDEAAAASNPGAKADSAADAATTKPPAQSESKPAADPKPNAKPTDDPITSLPGRQPQTVRFSSTIADDEPKAQLPKSSDPAVSDQASNNSDDAKTADQSGDTVKQTDDDRVQQSQPNTNLVAPPIRISLDAKGNLVLYSEDAEALDQLETLMRQIEPPKRPYEIFHLKHARASWIRLNLQDYFKDQEEESDNPFGFMFFDFPPQDKKKDDRNLSKKSTLRFVDDNDTKTLIVQGADEQTLATIRELIELWDKPTDDTNKKARYTKLVKVNYSQADAVAEAIKDAYRDLLSSNDKSFQQDGEKKESKRDGDDSIGSGGAMNFGGFSGKLSLGVDRVTNSIIVFAEGEDLLKLVIELIEDLDEAAKPSGSLQVVKLDGGISSKSLEKALKAMLESTRKPKDPNQQQQEQQQQLQQQQQQQANEQANFEGGQPGGGRRGRK